MQDPLFDLKTGKILRDIGIEKASSFPSDEWVSKAREYAVSHAISFREVSIDDVLKAYPRPSNIPPNATGAIMRDKRLKLSHYKQSSKISSHARVVGVYTLKE